MTLQQLLYFQTACKYQNISRAAEELHVSQPSVSVAIKNLEEEFKVPLIKRGRSGFTLTEDGEAFLKLADRLLEHAESVERVMYDRVQKHSRIRLGMPPMTGNILLSGIYAEFCPKHPDIELVTKEAGRKDLYWMLKDGVLDVAFLPHREATVPNDGASADGQAILDNRSFDEDRKKSDNYGDSGNCEFPDCHTMQVAEYEVVCCVADSHPLAKRAVITPKELEEEPLVIFSDDFYQNELIFDLFKKDGVVPRVMHTSSQLSTVERLVTDRIAVGFLFRKVAERCDGMVGIPFETPLVTRISLVWKKEHYSGEKMRSFLEFFRENGKY